MNGSIDVHAHAFPDSIAARAVDTLAKEADILAFSDGTIAGLLSSMDKAGVAASVIASIATKPSQAGPILEWSRAIAGERIIPFVSVHPDDPDAVRWLHAAADAGLRGVKLHPYYQKFNLDEVRLEPLWAAMAERGLTLLLHTGYDIAFPHEDICGPARVARLSARWPDLRLIAAHLGGWEDWNEVERHIIGQRIVIDTSTVVPFCGAERTARLLQAHPADCVVFGSDTPWESQESAIATLRSLGLPADLLEAILWKNAARLLGLSG